MVFLGLSSVTTAFGSGICFFYAMSSSLEQKARLNLPRILFSKAIHRYEIKQLVIFVVDCMHEIFFLFIFARKKDKKN